MGYAKVRIALRTLAMGVAALVPVACGNAQAPPSDDAKVESAIEVTCTATTAPPCTSALRYADVAPILQKRCVPCHEGAAGAPQWPLTMYSDIQPWVGVIQEELCGGTMPPADGGIAIDPSDLLTLVDWLQCGAPE